MFIAIGNYVANGKAKHVELTSPIWKLSDYTFGSLTVRQPKTDVMLIFGTGDNGIAEDCGKFLQHASFTADAILII